MTFLSQTIKSPWLIAPLLLLTLSICSAQQRAQRTAQAPQIAPKPAAELTHFVLHLEGAGPWYQLKVPMDVFFASKSTNLNDIRLLDANQELLPYAIYPAKQLTVSAQEFTAKIFPISRKNNAATATEFQIQSTENDTRFALSVNVQKASKSAAQQLGNQIYGWIIDAGQGNKPLHALRLFWHTPIEGFHRFSIEASNDLEHWQNWGNGQVANIDFQGEQIVQRDVTLPDQQARYVRLIWDEPNDAPTFSKAQITTVEANITAPELIWSQALHANVDKNGALLWHLPQSLPIQQLRFNLPQANSVTPVEIWGSNDDNPAQYWQRLNRTVLYRIPVKGREQVQDLSVLSGEPLRDIKLIADKRGTALTTQPPTLNVALQQVKLLILVRGKAPFELVAGTPNSEAGALPIATLMPDFDNADNATIGTATLEKITQVNTPKIAADSAKGETAAINKDQKKWILWSVLLLGVVVLLGMAWHVLKSVNTTKKEEAN